MNYIAVIDYEHLDDGMFLTALARSLGQQKQGRGIIIHKDSAYTERLIQTGIMREEAEVRSIKDLNHRLITLFADHGVSTIGLNGYQRSLIRQSGNSVKIDSGQLERLPAQPHLLISSLIEVESHKQPRAMELPLFAELLRAELNAEEILIFSLDQSEEILVKDRPEELSRSQLNIEFLQSQVPVEFRDIPIPVRLTSARLFSEYPSRKGTTRLLPDPS